MTVMQELNVVRHRLDQLVMRRLGTAFLAYEQSEWTVLIEREAELLAVTN